MLSLPFLGLQQAGGRGGAIQGKEGIKFCYLATLATGSKRRKLCAVFANILGHFGERAVYEAPRRHRRRLPGMNFNAAC